MNFNNQMNSEEGAGNGRFFMFVGAFLAIMLVAGGSYFVWNKYFSSEAITQRNYQKYLDWQANYEKVMKEDTYGGKTPQETLDMFIAALRAGDVELASRYFMLDESGKADQELVDGLKKARDTNELSGVINIISNVEFDKQHSSLNTVWFTVKNSEGVIDYSVIFKLNDFSKIWKIESL